MTMYNYDTLLPLGVKEPRELRWYLWDRVSKVGGYANLRPSEKHELDRIVRKIIWPDGYWAGSTTFPPPVFIGMDFAKERQRLIAEQVAGENNVASI